MISGSFSFRRSGFQLGRPVQVCNISECFMLVDSVVILKGFLISLSYTAGFVIPLDVQIVKQRH